MKEVDMVILSWAKNDALKEVTETGIRSCIEADPSVKFNFYVVESNPSVSYGVRTIHPNTEFGYHKFMNIGVKEGSAKYVCLCNNDLTYETGWATEIIKVMESQPYIQSASPWCPQTQGSNEEHKDKLYAGYTVRNEVAGWCIFQQRNIYDYIGELCEDVEFWYTNIKTCLTQINELPLTATQGEKDLVLMKLRQTLLDHHGGKEVVTVPEGISVFPRNLLFCRVNLLANLLSLMVHSL